MLPKINPMTTKAWRKLEEYWFGFEGTHMKDLFAADSNDFRTIRSNLKIFLWIFQKI